MTAIIQPLLAKVFYMGRRLHGQQINHQICPKLIMTYELAIN